MNLLLPPLAFLEGLGGPEVFLVMVIVMVLFGGEKLPEFARGAAKLMKEFKKASSGVEEEFKRALEEDEVKKTIAPTTKPLPHAITSVTTPDSDAPPPPPPSPASPPAPAPPPKMLPTQDGDSDP